MPKARLVALVGPLTGERHVVQTANHPLAPEKMLPMADVVLLVSDEDDSAMVFRYTAHGEFGGDTFHVSVADAKAETLAEYDEALLAWEEVPEDVSDAHTFAVRYAHDRLNNRDGDE
ncbi:MAG: hypothetical protein ACREBE_02790 [bacterium]